MGEQPRGSIITTVPSDSLDKRAAKDRLAYRAVSTDLVPLRPLRLQYAEYHFASCPSLPSPTPHESRSYVLPIALFLLMKETTNFESFSGLCRSSDHRSRQVRESGGPCFVGNPGPRCAVDPWVLLRCRSRIPPVGGKILLVRPLQIRCLTSE